MYIIFGMRIFGCQKRKKLFLNHNLMSLTDFAPTLRPTSITQLGVNTIYAATLGAFVGREIDIPFEYGAVALGAVYVVVTGPELVENAAYAGIDDVGNAIGVSGAGGAVKDFGSNIEKWWERVVEGKPVDDVYGKGSEAKHHGCELSKENLNDPKFWQRCYGAK